MLRLFTTKLRQSSMKQSMTLNNNYCFDSFKVGLSNQFAHAASNSIAERPGENFNPLVICGDVGLGKTHLLNAIGLKVVTLYPDFKVFCVSAEDFMNDLMDCIYLDRKQAFREKYEKLDCLLIDDIQFIAGRESVQDELFHVFNTLHVRKKQIVATSDVYPMYISNLDGRLRSMFNNGLTADLQQPDDIETKLAIVKRTASEIGLTLSNDTVENIALNTQTAKAIQLALVLYLIIPYLHSPITTKGAQK